jgi:ferrous-iron efflux pump FieF
MTDRQATSPNPPPVSGEEARRWMRRATTASVLVAAILVAMKVVAWLQTGSVAMLASLLDSMLDGLASLVNFVAVRFALKPPDKEHRHGHGKAEALAGLGQAVLILGSSAFVFHQSITRLINPVPLNNEVVGVVVILIAMALTAVLVLYQRVAIRKSGSLAIGADELHYRSDLLSGAGVVLALGLSALAGLHWADPVIGLAIAGYVAWAALSIVGRAYDQLMDREFPDEDRARILKIARGHPMVREVHELRTRRAGPDRFIQLHLTLDGDLPLRRAHDIGDEVMHAIRDAFPDADVLIHKDPG